MNPTKKHIYFVPGLAANTKIFEYIKLPADLYELHFIEWLIPESSTEEIEHYAKRMSNFVDQPNAILVGVSFGGIMVQEMKKFVNPEKVIIISSVKNKSELPRHMRFAQKTNFHKIFPIHFFSKIEKLEKFAFTSKIKRKILLYKKYLSMRNSDYLRWSINAVINWERDKTDPSIIHIHGTDDFVFPAKNLENFIKISNGTHIMILNKSNQISSILTNIL